MPIAEISTALKGIKVAIDIAKGVSAAEALIQQATFKLKIAELMEALADSKMAMVSVSEQIEARDKEIARLNDLVEYKSKVVRVRDGYYEVDENGKPKGDAHCQTCWEANRKLVHLSYSDRINDPVVCNQCKSKYTFDRVQPSIEKR